MKIGSVSGTNAQAGMGNAGTIGASDPYGKSIKRQIANAQKELQELSANKEIPVEEKMKKRQEIQQRINDLNNQLHQHEIEQRRERMQEKKSSMDEMSGRNQNASQTKNNQRNTGISQAGMKAMISADVSMKQAQAQGKVATEMKGRARVMAGEIAQDKARGLNVEKKESELAKLEERIEDVKASQIKTLSKAGKEMQEASKEDSESKTVSKEDKAGSKEGNDVSKEDKAGSKESNGVSKENPAGEETTASVKTMEESAEAEREDAGAEKAGKEEELPEGYVPVDVRL